MNLRVYHEVTSWGGDTIRSHVGFFTEEHHPQGLLGIAPQKKHLAPLQGTEGSPAGGDSTMSIYSCVHSDFGPVALPPWSTQACLGFCEGKRCLLMCRSYFRSVASFFLPLLSNVAQAEYGEQDVSVSKGESHQAHNLSWISWTHVPERTTRTSHSLISTSAAPCAQIPFYKRGEGQSREIKELRVNLQENQRGPPNTHFTHMYTQTHNCNIYQKHPTSTQIE